MMPPDPISAAIDALGPSRNGGASLLSAPPKPLSIYVGNIYGRAIEPMHWMAVDSLRSAARQRELNLRVRFQPNWNDALLCRSRSVTATAFLLDSDAEVHVSIDGDIVFEAWQVAQIARQAVEHGMVGGLYVTRSRDDARPTSIPYTNDPIECGDDPTPKPVRWIATGFLATHRRVFERLAQDLPLCHRNEPWRFYPFYQPYAIPHPEDPEGSVYLSEDFAFCQRAIDAGFQPHIAPNIRIYHLGLHPFRLEDMAQKPIPEQSLRLTHTGGRRFLVEA